MFFSIALSLRLQCHPSRMRRMYFFFVEIIFLRAKEESKHFVGSTMIEVAYFYNTLKLNWIFVPCNLRFDFSLSIATPNNLRTGGVGQDRRWFHRASPLHIRSPGCSWHLHIRRWSLQSTYWIRTGRLRRAAVLGRSLRLILSAEPKPRLTSTFTLQPFNSQSCRTSQIPTHEMSTRRMVVGRGACTPYITNWISMASRLHFNRRIVHAKDLEAAHSCIGKTREMIKTTDSYSKDSSSSNKYAGVTGKKSRAFSILAHSHWKPAGASTDPKHVQSLAQLPTGRLSLSSHSDAYHRPSSKLGEALLRTYIQRCFHSSFCCSTYHIS